MGRLPTCYSPVRRYSDAGSRKSEVGIVCFGFAKTITLTSDLGLPSPEPLDLHVLGTPPAFVLSQDQTLMLKFYLCSMSLDYAGIVFQALACGFLLKL